MTKSYQQYMTTRTTDDYLGGQVVECSLTPTKSDNGCGETIYPSSNCWPSNGRDS